MHDLIKIQPQAIGGQTIETVNARELHSFLEVQTRYNDWIARRISEYGFVEESDFYSFLSESSSGRPSKEYAISLAVLFDCVHAGDCGSVILIFKGLL